MKTEIYVDLDGQELTKTTWYDGGDIVYKNKQGLKHRLDGPAVTYPNGYQAWWKDGKRHREDGPAVVHSTGTEKYYLEGIQLTKREVDLYWLKKQVEE